MILSRRSTSPSAVVRSGRERSRSPPMRDRSPIHLHRPDRRFLGRAPRLNIGMLGFDGLIFVCGNWHELLREAGDSFVSTPLFSARRGVLCSTRCALLDEVCSARRGVHCSTRYALPDEDVDDVPPAQATSRIEPGRWLVENSHSRPDDHDSCEADTASQPSRESPHRAVSGESCARGQRS